MFGITIQLFFVLLSQLGQLHGDCRLYKEIVRVKITEPSSLTTEVNFPVCFGTCQTFSYLKSGSGQTGIEHEMSCCMPTKYKTINVTFLGFDGSFRWKLYDAIEECGCYSCSHI